MTDNSDLIKALRDLLTHHLGRLPETPQIVASYDPRHQGGPWAVALVLDSGYTSPAEVMEQYAGWQDAFDQVLRELKAALPE